MTPRNTKNPTTATLLSEKSERNRWKGVWKPPTATGTAVTFWADAVMP